MRKQTILFKLSMLVLVCILPFYSCGQKNTGEKPLVVFVTGDHEYSSEQTMPLIAAELEKNYGFRTAVLKSSPDHTSEENIPGLEILEEADLAVFFLRWRRLPEDQIKYIDDYLKSGKPVMGFRTSTHAFNYPAGHPLEKWNAFGEFALGGPGGWGAGGHSHYGNQSTTEVSVLANVPEGLDAILTGIQPLFNVRSWLYTVLPDYPLKDATPLMMGAAKGAEEGAIDQPVAWTWQTPAGGRVFTTTLGHPEDFNEENTQHLVINAIHWCLGLDVPAKWAGPFKMNVPYRTH